MSEKNVASTDYLMKHLENMLEKKKKSKGGLSYQEFSKKMNEIPMINQLKRNYQDSRSEGYSCETAFKLAKIKTYEEYMEYMLSGFKNRDYSVIKNNMQLKQGFDIIKDEPIYLTQFLEDSFKLGEKMY